MKLSSSNDEHWTGAAMHMLGPYTLDRQQGMADSQPRLGHNYNNAMHKKIGPGNMSRHSNQAVGASLSLALHNHKHAGTTLTRHARNAIIPEMQCRRRRRFPACKTIFAGCCDVGCD